MHNLQQQLEMWFWQTTIAAAAISVIGTVFTCWIAYSVIKAAIRDGIKESGMVETWARTVATTRDRQHDVIPDMRADR